MNSLKTYQNYYDLIFTGHGYFSYDTQGNILYNKNKCDNCIQINKNSIFWNMFLLNSVKSKKRFIKPFYIIKRDEISKYLHIFSKEIYYKITLPNIQGNDMIITNKLEDFVKFVKYTGDSLFLLEKYFVQQMLYNYKKIKYRYIVVTINNKPILYPIHQVLLSKYDSKIKNELKQEYTLKSDNDYKYIYGKQYSDKTLKRAKNIIKDIYPMFNSINSNNKSMNYTFYAIDFIYDVDQNLFIDNIQNINDINFDNNIKVLDDTVQKAYYGYLGKNIHDYLVKKESIFLEIINDIEGFKSSNNNIYITIFLLILWVLIVLNR